MTCAHTTERGGGAGFGIERGLRGRTGLDLGALLLVRKELAQVGLVLVIELLEIGILEVDLGGAHGCVRGWA